MSLEHDQEVPTGWDSEPPSRLSYDGQGKDEADLDLIDMSKFPSAEYSNSQVRQAGELIASNLPWTDETDARIREAFAIANNWRDAHAYPMRSIRFAVIRIIERHDAQGKTAARLKRMPAIRRKIQRLSLRLHQIQDLGGCRAIMESVDDVHKLVAATRTELPHEIFKEDDYIASPKEDGYRGHHTIFKFKAADTARSTFNGKRVELQIRTKLQHSWATAVEAVGLFRGEELKNQKGDEKWLRLFLLMSGELAEVEGCPAPEGCRDAQLRRTEIRSLAADLGALTVLETIKEAVKGTEIPHSFEHKPSHYLIIYDRVARTVRVEPKSTPHEAALSYGEAESLDNLSGTETQTRVLVEVDKIENLKAAYPNYFGDVQSFIGYLRSVISGSSAVEYARVSQERKTWMPPAAGDPSWLRRNPFPRPDSGKGRLRK